MEFENESTGKETYNLKQYVDFLDEVCEEMLLFQETPEKRNSIFSEELKNKFPIIKSNSTIIGLVIGQWEKRNKFEAEKKEAA